MNSRKQGLLTNTSSWIVLTSLLAFSYVTLADTQLVEYQTPLPVAEEALIIIPIPFDKLNVGEDYFVTAPSGETFNGPLIDIDEQVNVIPFNEGKGSLKLQHHPEKGNSITFFLTETCQQFSANLDEGGVGVLYEEASSEVCDDLSVKSSFNSTTTIELPDTVIAETGPLDVRRLESRPNSPYTILLDFWGGTIFNTYWNMNYTYGIPIVYDAYDFQDGDPSSLTILEKTFIHEAWTTTSEDFAPFVVNVTTDVDVYNATPASQRARNIITSKPWWYPSPSGGVGMVGGWGSSYTNISWTWYNDPDQFGNAAQKFALQSFLGTIASHEVGHTLGLDHHGDNSQPSNSRNRIYYPGHGDWGPIMGVPRGKTYTQWSRGDYPLATRPQQNDIDIIRATLPIRPDDVGDTASNAQQLYSFQGGAQVYEISPRWIKDDKDWFTFTITEPKLLDLLIQPMSNEFGYAAASNLAMSGRVRYENIQNPFTFDSGDSAPLSPDTNIFRVDDELIQPGTYYIEIYHDSPDTNPATGFRNYDNGGLYSIDFRLKPVSPPSIDAPIAGSTLSADRVEVSWDNNNTPINNWRLLAGSTPGGAEWSDSGVLGASDRRKYALNLPIDGQLVYLTLEYLPQWGNPTTWQSITVQVNAATLTKPAIVNPRNRTAIEDRNVTFSWQNNDFSTPKYRLLVGSSSGASDIFTGTITNRTYQAVDLSNVSAAQTLFVTLQYRHNTRGIGWHEMTYTYQAPGGSSILDIGRPGKPSNPTYIWSAVEDALEYELEIHHVYLNSPTYVEQFSAQGKNCHHSQGEVCIAKMRGFPIKDEAEVRVRVNRDKEGWSHWSLPYLYTP